MMSFLDRLWTWVRALLDILFLIRFSVVLGIIGIVLFVEVPQGREILRHLSQAPGDGRAPWFLVATVLCAISTWYCARILLDFDFDSVGMRNLPREHPWIRDWLPRALAASIPAAFAIELSGPTWLKIVLWIAAVLLLVLTWLRRHRLEGERNIWRSVRGLSFVAKIYWAGSLVLYAICLIVFSLSWGQHVAAPGLGAAAVVLIGLGVLIPLGAMLVYAGHRRRFPFLGTILVYSIFISWFSDNHDVRTLPAATGIEGYEDLADYYRDWRDDLLARTDSGSVPVYVISAEGGGIRAAYWTARVLGTLQEESQGRFARHVFAISGVSGGSVGASLFASQVASPDPSAHPVRSRRMLAEDVLSPTLASLVFPDMFQRLLPWPAFPDRAEALETAWEKAWRDNEKGVNRFAAAMDSLWSENPFEVPLLFLNSTVVESGDRIILQPLKMTPEAFAGTFRQADDARHVLGDAVRLSTAALMSARFTYVSPAGSIDRRDHPGKSIRVVDGGYFENSGAVTAEEILDTILAEETAGGRIEIVLLHISNDPWPVTSETKEEERQEPRIFLGEALSPLRALLHARSSRGFQAREHLWQAYERATGREVVHFDLFEKDVELPLGWLLSKTTFDEMDQQLDLEQGREKVARALERL